MKSHHARRLGAGLVGLTLAVSAAGCSSSPAAPGTIELIHWWTSTGESAALAAALAGFAAKHPEETVIPEPVSGSTNARAMIESRMSGNEPPDTFQANGGWDLLEWVLYNHVDDGDSKMTAIDERAAEQHWKDYIPAPVLATVSYGDHIYAVPLDVHRVNTLFYNKQVFADAGVAPPTTLDELFAVAATFQARGVTPIALGSNDPWTLPLLLYENLLVARAGATYYQDFFHGRGDAFGPEIGGALADLVKLLSFTNADAQLLTWSQAVDRVGDGTAAMTIMGDWAKAQLLPHGIDTFGEIPMPGTAGTFVFTTDTFGLPRGALNPRGTLDLLEFFGSKDGQDAFNPLKGSISARSDADVSLYDALGQQTFADFMNPSTAIIPATALVAPPAFMDQMNATFGAFAGGDATVAGNTSVVLHVIDNFSDLLRSNLL
jgi:glucose/mannose transport system substrate-binding protein